MKEKNTLFYRFITWIARPFFKILYNVKIVGKERIPEIGPIIFAGNHLNIKDQLPVIASTKRVIHWMSKKEYFDGKHAWFFKKMKCICVDRENHGGDSLDIAKSYLLNSSAIGIFPEGTRNKTKEELLPFKIGTVYLAQKTKATIVPFAITGDFKIRSKNTVLRYGIPFKINPEDDLKQQNEYLRKTILKLQQINYQETGYDKKI